MMKLIKSLNAAGSSHVKNLTAIRSPEKTAAYFCTEKKVQKHREDDKLQNKVQNKLEVNRILTSFAPKENYLLDLHRYNPMSFTSERFNQWIEMNNKKNEIYRQRFIKERHDILGCDLATAHFIVYRNGRIKFKDSDNWIEKSTDEDSCPDLPEKFVRNLYLEAVDASNTNIRYEGLENFINLTQLKWLSFRNCKHVDDWFIDRLSLHVSETVEYLDLSGCNNLTKNALSCIYRFRKLKLLILQNIDNTKEFEYSCMFVEDSFPDLIISSGNCGSIDC